jgi:ornithine--oxo-acid transaminase
VLSNHEVLSVLRPGEHGSTFGGNPLACAVARTALRVLVQEHMVENALVMGEYFMSGLRSLHAPVIKEIRGKGLMIGVELHPGAGSARDYCEKLMNRGILCKDTHEQTIRLAPPLVIQREDIDWALEAIRQALVPAGAGWTSA